MLHLLGVAYTFLSNSTPHTSSVVFKWQDGKMFEGQFVWIFCDLGKPSDHSPDIKPMLQNTFLNYFVGNTVSLSSLALLLPVLVNFEC